MIIPRPEDFHHIEIGGLLITEPVTAGTDLLVAILSFSLSLKLSRSTELPFRRQYWTLFFLFMGASTFAGTVTHGFRYYLSGNGMILVFSLMNILTALTCLYAQTATLRFLLKEVSLQVKWALFILFALFMIAFFVEWRFTITNIYITIGYLFVLYHHIKKKRIFNGAGYIVNGILISFATAVVFSFKLSVSDIWFNHKDIAHVIMMLSIYVMHKGARIIQATP